MTQLENNLKILNLLAGAASDIHRTARSAKGSSAGEAGTRGVTEGVNHKAPLPADEPVLLPPPGHPVRAGGCFASAQC